MKEKRKKMKNKNKNNNNNKNKDKKEQGTKGDKSYSEREELNDFVVHSS